MSDGKNGVTYADAGVDIDAGNALVERIKPAVRKTMRPEVLTGLGGFGALFDLKAAGYHDPILVAATDGVGTKLRIAIDTSEVSGVGIDPERKHVLVVKSTQHFHAGFAPISKRVLYAGDLGALPADMRLLEAVNLRIDEAPLTGESVPVTKEAGSQAAAEISGQQPQ